MVPTLFFYYVSVDGCCSKMPWFQHCSSILSVWMVVVLTCHGATLFFYYVSVDGCFFLKCHGSNIVLLLCQCGWLFFSKMPWFQHCSSIMSVWMVVFLTCHVAKLFFYNPVYDAIDTVRQ